MRNDFVALGLVLYGVGWGLQPRIRAPQRFPAPTWLRWVCLCPWIAKLDLRCTSLQLGALAVAGALFLPPHIRDTKWLPALSPVVLIAIGAILDRLYWDKVEFGRPASGGGAGRQKRGRS